MLAKGAGLDGPIGGPRPRHRARPPPRRHRPGAAGHRRRRSPRVRGSTPRVRSAQWIDTFLRVLIGSAVVLLPIALAAIAVVLMRTEPDPEARPRLILGAAMITLPVLGLWHLWAGSPTDPAGRQHAAGFIGFAIGGPLSDGLTAWIAAPLLFIGALFGLLLVTGTTIREVPSTRARDVRHPARVARRRRVLRRDDEPAEVTPTRSPRTSPTATTTIRRPTATTRRRRGPSGTPMENYPLDDEAPTVPEPDSRRDAQEEAGQAADAVTRPRRRGSVHAAAAGPAEGGRSAEAAQRGQRPHGRGDHRGAASSSRSTPRSPASPAARPSPATRSSSGPASRSRRSPRCRRTSPTPWPPRACGCSRRSPASPPSASRCPTPTARWCGWPTC